MCRGHGLDLLSVSSLLNLIILLNAAIVILALKLESLHQRSKLLLHSFLESLSGCHLWSVLLLLLFVILLVLISVYCLLIVVVTFTSYLSFGDLGLHNHLSILLVLLLIDSWSLVVILIVNHLWLDDHCLLGLLLVSLSAKLRWWCTSGCL